MSASILKTSPFEIHNKTVSSQQATGGLEPYTGPWNKATASHLVRRTHFGIKVSDLNFVRSFDDAQSAVDELITRASTEPLPDDPAWAKNGASGDILDFYQLQLNWMDRMYNGGLLEKMMLFWSNHFVVGYNSVSGKAESTYANHMNNYYKLLHADAFGNFKDLVNDVSINTAMLYYLNGYVNDGRNISNGDFTEANQDFGRELLELFTMGILDREGNPNYTDSNDAPYGDIQHVAAACTGWRVNNSNFTPFFDDDAFYSGNKTIFGQTANFDLQGVVDLIFDTKPNEVAWYICKKLYTFFVSAEPNEQIIGELADYFVQQNFEIAPTLSRLLSSAHFYDPVFYGSRIKSPVELYLGFLREMEIAPNANLREYMRVNMPGLNQELLNPPNVAGWPGFNPPASDGIPGHYVWLNTSVLPARWSQLAEIAQGEGGALVDVQDLARKISDPSDPFALALDLARHFISLPLDRVGIRQVDEDFEGGAQEVPQFVRDMPDYEQNLIKILLAGTPWYDWSKFYESQTARIMLTDYISYLFQLPAYQLT